MYEDALKKTEKFFFNYKHQLFKKGEIVIRADEDPIGVYFIKRGLVKVYCISPSGEELILSILKHPAIFPLSWVMTGKHNVFYYEAVEESELWRAPVINFIKFIKEEQSILFDLFLKTFLGFDEVFERLLQLMGGNAFSRLASELVLLAHTFGNKANHNSRVIKIDISEKDLAALTGMTRETVSREIKELRNRKLITYKKNNVLIKDLEQLVEVTKLC